MTKNLLTDMFSEPLSDATTAALDVNAGDGNLIIDRLARVEQVLVTGTLQYFEEQGLPIRSRDSNNGHSRLTLEGQRSKRAWFHLPWAGCNGATEWQIHLTPGVSFDITAHSNGGNIKLNLAGIDVTRVSTDNGGGNVDVVLPEDAADLSVTARTGGGNVTVEMGKGLTGSSIVDARSGAGTVVVYIPRGVAARIQAATGLGKVIVDPSFSQIGSKTYQSADFDRAANKVEIMLQSGAGNVMVNTK